MGGLVGKTREIDPETRFNQDYVRIHIACMDITKVPRTARCTLGMAMYEFIYEREVVMEEGERALKSGVIVSNPQNTPQKQNMPGGSSSRQPKQQEGRSVSKFARMGTGYDNSQSQSENTMKCTIQKAEGSPTKKDTTKVEIQEEGMCAGKEIRNMAKSLLMDPIMESDDESETYSDYIKRKGGNTHAELKWPRNMKEVGDTKIGQQKKAQVAEEASTLNLRTSAINKEKMTTLKPSVIHGTKITNLTSSPEVYITDDHIINTQDSVNDDEINTNEGVGKVTQDGVKKMLGKVDNVMKNQSIDDEILPQEKRRSERLSREITMTTQEKIEIMAKKRSLEGNTLPQKSISELSYDSFDDNSKKWGLW